MLVLDQIERSRGHADGCIADVVQGKYGLVAVKALPPDAKDTLVPHVDSELRCIGMKGRLFLADFQTL